MMSKLWTLGYALFTLGGVLLLADGVGAVVALPACCMWWPDEAMGVLRHAVGLMGAAVVLSFAGFALSKACDRSKAKKITIR